MLKFIESRVQEAIQHPQRMPARVADRLDRRLGLSDQQRSEVQAILTRRQQELFAIRRKVQPQIETVLNGIEVDVAGALDPAQKEKWLSDAQDFRQRFTPPLPPDAPDKN